MTAITSCLQQAVNSTNQFVQEHPIIAIVLGGSVVGLSAMHSIASAVAALAAIVIGSLIIYLLSSNVEPSGVAAAAAPAGNGPGRRTVHINAPDEASPENSLSPKGEGEVEDELEFRFFPLPIQNMRKPTKNKILKYLRHTPKKDWLIALDGALKLLEHNKVAQQGQPRHAATRNEENNTVKMIEILVSIKDPIFIEKALPLMTFGTSSAERIKIVKRLALEPSAD